ncbi:MAG: ATP-binding protein [Bacteroidetes bacterium]|nr:MAG: ATP-binding protein [Bacteroidota bacterium]REK06557.1 MAG: ATP-binding protein [Bacteroidota bacterium]REK33323.1 MAG: ATP-binding protein [Bacteroidota bacterium]
MAESQIEALTRQFYEWETWGRGWKLYESPVDLEPPFAPFFFRFNNNEYVDDGKRHTLFSYLGELFKQKKKQVPEKEVFVREPFLYNLNAPLEIVTVSLPKGEKVTATQMEQLLTLLSLGESNVSFEIIATCTLIRIQFVSSTFNVPHLKAQVKAFFPSAVIQTKNDLLLNNLTDDSIIIGRDFGLAEEFMRPLLVPKNFDIDPYTGLFGTLDNLRQGEQVCIQILFKATENPWTTSIINSVTDCEGRDFFLDAPEMLPAAREKISSPLFSCVIRLLCVADNNYEAERLLDRVSNHLILFSESGLNKLIPLSLENIDANTFISDFLLRQSRRLGMLINAKELSTLAHFPSTSIHSVKLERDTGKSKRAPTVTNNHPFILGLNTHDGRTTEVSISNEQRLRHMHVIGATGTGKSTFILDLILKDIHLNNGIAVLDPHGDLIETILGNIPSERHKDVIVIDPSDSEFPVGLNILTAHSDIEKEVLASDLVGVFRRLSTSWGDQMNSVFSNAILALLESLNGGTLFDLRRFLIEKSFREIFLKSVTDTNVRYYWEKEFPIVKSTSIGPILTRLDTFLRPKLVRNMVAQKKSIDFEAAMNEDKIILVKLSQGLIGAENSFLLGSFIVSKIHQAAMARQSVNKAERKDFFLYIDEFQYFITPSMSSILSGARKYHLGLILAHQDMQQLVKSDSELASSVISNAGTRVCFRLGDTDAKKFEDGFSYFEARDLQGLETGRAICRIEKPEYDFNLEVLFPELSDDFVASRTRDEVINVSREKYGTPKNQIEDLTKVLSVTPTVEYKIDKEIQSQTTVALTTKITPEVETQKPVSVKRNKVPETEVEKTVAGLVRQKELSEHRYLQMLIKRMAEARGYKATVEEHIKESNGRVDVSLERNGKRIACEVCMTTTDNWEVHNIEKCLKAGYDLVLECSTNKKTLERIRKKVDETFPESLRGKILILEPEYFFQYLDSQIASEASTEVKVKGYRVKVEYNPLPPEEIKKKKEEIKKVIYKPKP